MPETSIKLAAKTIEASFAALPTLEDIEKLVSDSQAAEARGYYDPVEDERLRETYTSYLSIRVAVWQVIQSLKPNYKPFKTGNLLQSNELHAFGVAFSGAEIIVRTGEYLIELAKKRDLVWKKLDEEEVRYGLKRKSFTRLYRQLTSAFRMRSFYRARDYFDQYESEILRALSDSDMSRIKFILTQLNLPTASRGEHLKRYQSFLGFSLRRRGVSALRNILFKLFEGTGEDIAELKIPFVKPKRAPKRVTTDVLKKLSRKLRPGDVFITRHDDAMSNLFLPGFWPHGAFYIGTSKERQTLGIEVETDGFRNSDEAGIDILEAKKDGVLLREISDTLMVDAFVVLRPKLPQAQINLAIERGLSHAGKLYDFIFDFSTADRVVCTEVIYRAYHGIGGVNFVLTSKAGRHYLSAEDILNQGIANKWFEPVIIYGVGGNELLEDAEALGRLRDSFEAVF